MKKRILKTADVLKTLLELNALLSRRSLSTRKIGRVPRT